MKTEFKSGVYSIKNNLDGKQYIGSSHDINGRFSKHMSLLNNNKHHTPKLQRSWNKYGCNNFSFNIILFCSKRNLIFYEQRAIDRFSSLKHGYNILPMAGRTSGYKHTPKAILNMSKAQKGRIVSKETREKHSKTITGRKLSPEHVENMRKSMIGKNTMPEDDPRREALAERNRNMVFTPEIRAKMIAAKLGKKRGPQSKEHRAKISNAVKNAYEHGRLVASREPRSDETKAKVSEGLRRYHARRKNKC